jgi:hypothetical protein
MGLFDVKIGNKNIDKSKTIRENINETILENITNSQYAVKTSGVSKQEIILDCSGSYRVMLDAYSKNSNWGPPPSIAEFSKTCSITNALLDSTITLNVNSTNIQNFSLDLENNIKRDFDQMELSTKDKNWVEIGGFNKNINESENIKRIIDNVKKANIRNIVQETLTDANIDQSIKINVGSASNVTIRAKILLTATAISDTILKDIDNTFVDTVITQLEKTEETDQVSKGITGMFSNAMSTVKSAIGAGAGMFIGFILLIAFIAYFAPFLFCFIPGANTIMGDACKKTDLNKRNNEQIYYDRRY